MNTGPRSGTFCPRCGDPVTRPPESDLPGGPEDPDAVLCDECYFENFDLVDAPDRIEVKVCSRCGAVARGNRWIDIGAGDYTDIAIEETTDQLSVHVDARDVDWGVEPDRIDENTIHMHCLFTGVIRSTPLQEEVTVPVYFSREICERCGRIAGDYYASIIQVRGTDRPPTEIEKERAIEIAEDHVAERAATGDRDAFISQIEQTADGVDMKISTNQLGQGIAHRITRELGGTVSESPTLVTKNEEGSDVYRVTFTARLPPYTSGDILLLDDEEGPVLVTSARGNLKGRRLDSGEWYEASYEDGLAPEATKVGSRADATRTTVVSRIDERAVQVLDPATQETKTISRPSYMDQDAESVPVIKHRKGLHILPESEAQER